MLETLDHLADRIGQLADQSRALYAERAHLRAALQQAETTCGTLTGRCDTAEAALAAALQRLAECEAALAAEQTRAQQQATELRAQLAQQQTQAEQLAAQHDASQCALQRLRTVGDQTRARIDAVLARLPGGVSTEAPADASTEPITVGDAAP